ncbi:hypothetical protein JC794_12990 [Morganella morganii]|uniref:hypothetical protein n=1 Tax=Morganella morganii TaxID=582 RepID=UPI000D1DCE9A|nr:hypothetical protein [Morganella morganii]HAE77081.1 hypothetical protein [Morganella sp. (in: enterobacteria)]QXO41481.1 hypothetical protein CXB74_012530 [Morganella morganii]QXO45179.1 hypothetical protein JC862_12360 [Morganella morganii]QXO48684.1 hypothetical protein JC861_12445 [Morganella morganii]QXO52549.1 hypothetical protein JC830_12450 [Morganella morganii]
MKRLLLPLISFFLLLSSIYFYLNTYLADKIPSLYCYAQVQYNYERNGTFDVMNTGIGYSLNNGEGTIAFSAYLRRDNQLFNIKRDIKVTYKMTEKNSFLLDVKEINISPLDNLPEDLSHLYMYNYTRKKGGWFNMGVKPNGKNSYIMYTNTIPQFLCKKI